MSRWIKFGLSLAITVASLWWTFRGTDWDGLAAALRYANWWALLWYFLILCVIHVARTKRWGNLLSGIEQVPFRRLNEASAIGFMMLVILPFRLGEFARPFLIAQRSSIRRSAAMTSVVLERIVDGVAIAVMLRALLFFVPKDAPMFAEVQVAGTLMFVVFFSGFLFLLLARWQHDRVIALLRWFGRPAPRLTERFIHIVDGFVSALRQLPDRGNLARFAAWTVIYWVANGFGMSLFANAFDCSGAAAAGAACQPLHLSAFEGYVVLGVLIVGMMIPAAPGAAGTSQFAVKVALGLFVPAAVVNASGVAYANVLWIAQMLQQIAFGLYFMLRSHLSFREIAGTLSDESRQGAGA